MSRPTYTHGHDTSTRQPLPTSEGVHFLCLFHSRKATKVKHTMTRVLAVATVLWAYGLEFYSQRAREPIICKLNLHTGIMQAPELKVQGLTCKGTQGMWLRGEHIRIVLSLVSQG